MRKTLYIWIFLSILAFSYSCQNAEEFLDKKPLGEYSEVDVWNDLALAETFVNGIYKNALGWPFAIERLSDYSDESHFTPDWGVTNFNKSLMTQDDWQGWSWGWATPHTLHLRWDPLYLNVRRTNIFFSKINENTFDDENWKNRLIGEVYFLRGYTYHMLTSMFGGVPIITKAYTLTDNFEVPRNTYEECINYIVGQLDSAAMYLPESSGDLGRATKGAALALKARVLLYAASDLHHQMNTYAPGYANPELIGFTGGSQQARWQAAKDAAQAVMDLGIYDLYKKSPAPGDSIAQNFVDYFTTKGETDEDILLQCFSTKTTSEGWAHYNPALYCGPNGYHNWGNNTPLGDLVDDYEMRDGSKFDWSNPVHKANPYANRDQRLYATILYEGVQWRTRPSDGLLLDPYSKIQVGAVYNTDGVTMLKAGLDTRKGPIEDWNGGKTGYYVRKFVDPTFDPQYVAQEVPFRHIRYAEVLLNYAEACIELGEEGPARDAINQIRARAGQPAITESGAALRERYRQERRIELVYEDQRFWDVRRWLIGPAAYHPTSVVSVMYKVDAASVASYRQPDGSSWGDPVFEKIDFAGDERAWDDKCYFFAIYRDEMGKNPALIQNPGF
ncbi:MAG TPA: RagB/SusD family nutrient uptake outer membrane protein [Bacteroidales bacterium]|nr:RagB/SusD family nutrient uptake outer membrane protein [Bacteroidales bacterium]